MGLIPYQEQVGRRRIRDQLHIEYGWMMRCEDNSDFQNREG